MLKCIDYDRRLPPINDLLLKVGDGQNETFMELEGQGHVEIKQDFRIVW